MKRKLLVCALVACAMTLCLALTGCGGGGATNDKDAKEAFIGSWKLAGMVSDGEEATAEDIAMLDAFGMSVGLDVNEDGTCALIMFGEPLDGTWEAKSATEATFTIDGSPITATIADGKLKMDEDGYDGVHPVLISECGNQTAAQLLHHGIDAKWPGAPVRIVPCSGLCSFYAQDQGIIITY